MLKKTDKLVLRVLPKPQRVPSLVLSGQRLHLILCDTDNGISGLKYKTQNELKAVAQVKSLDNRSNVWSCR